jgi:hypothetical protein
VGSGTGRGHARIEDDRTAERNDPIGPKSRPIVVEGRLAAPSTIARPSPRTCEEDAIGMEGSDVRVGAAVRDADDVDVRPTGDL